MAGERQPIEFVLDGITWKTRLVLSASTDVGYGQGKIMGGFYDDKR